MKATWNVFRSSFNTHLRLTLVRPMFQIALITQPLVMATIAYMVYRRTGEERDFISFVVLGAGIAGIWSGIVFSSAGDIDRERFYGTLSTIFSAPSSLITVLLGKIMANGLLSSLSLAISFVFSSVVLRISLYLPHPLAFGLALLVFLVAINLFALTLSSIFLLSRSATIMRNFLEYPLLIVTGVFFPLEALPGWLQPLGWPVPLTWGAKALRWTVQAQWNKFAFWEALGIEVGLAALYLVLSLILFRLIERRVRVTASLDVY
jgi:ABC-2 type transport system permease protein